MTRRVVITGLGVVSPIGNNANDFWQGIIGCRSGAGPIDRFDVSDFRTKFACQVKDLAIPQGEEREWSRLDLFAQFAMLAAIEAMESSGIDTTQLENPTRYGIIAASGIGGLATIEQNHITYLKRGPSRISPFMIPMMMINAAAGHIAIRFGFQGPNFSTASACASSQHAFGAALDAVRSGSCDVILAGGSEATITPLGVGGFNSMKALSLRNDDPTGASRPFSGSRDGFVMGEGGAMFVFEEEEHAKARGARILAHVSGFGMTDDSGHITAPMPGGEMATAAMRAACKDGGIDPTDVTYVNAHGTSTKLNDEMETRAIKALLGPAADRVMVSSTKSQVGHLLGASGAVELAAVVLGIVNGVVPPTINYQDPDPECDLDYVPNEPRETPIEHALSNSFGFGGHNASLLVSRYV